MKKFNFLVFIVLGLFFTACNSEVNTKPKEVKFDREVCERCKMIISDRNYAVQVVNPQDGKSYYHDDIGCAILWFEESEISWKNEAIIHIYRTLELLAEKNKRVKIKFDIVGYGNPQHDAYIRNSVFSNHVQVSTPHGRSVPLERTLQNS